MMRRTGTRTRKRGGKSEAWIKCQCRGNRTMLKRLYVGCVSLPSSIACLAVFHCPVVGVVAEGLNMPRMFVNFPAAMASTVWLREKVYCTGSHMFDCEG